MILKWKIDMDDLVDSLMEQMLKGQKLGNHLLGCMQKCSSKHTENHVKNEKAPWRYLLHARKNTTTLVTIFSKDE